jgi:hypothetical protein
MHHNGNAARQQYALPVPLVRAGHDRLTIPMNRPTCHSAVAFVGIASLARTGLSQVPQVSEAIHATAYAIAVLAALVLGKLLGRTKSPRTARLITSCLGMTGLVLAAIASGVPIGALIGAGVTLGALSVTGEMLYRRNPADTPQAAGDRNGDTDGDNDLVQNGK